MNIELPPDFSTWNDFYTKIKEQQEIDKYEFSIEFIKAKCFDEITANTDHLEKEIITLREASINHYKGLCEWRNKFYDLQYKLKVLSGADTSEDLNP